MHYIVYRLYNMDQHHTTSGFTLTFQFIGQWILGFYRKQINLKKRPILIFNSIQENKMNSRRKINEIPIT